jgi:hypothetical protein
MMSVDTIVAIANKLITANRDQGRYWAWYCDPRISPEERRDNLEKYLLAAKEVSTLIDCLHAASKNNAGARHFFNVLDLYNDRKDK